MGEIAAIAGPQTASLCEVCGMMTKMYPASQETNCLCHVVRQGAIFCERCGYVFPQLREWNKAMSQTPQTSGGDSPNAWPCQWCGAYHTGVCRRVKSIDYYPDGTIKRIEFFAGENIRHE